MIYKRNEFKINKVLCKKIVCSIIFALYIIGLCAGSAFALKNADNFAFIEKVTFTVAHTESLISANSAGIIQYFIRDILLIISGWILINSGILKCLILCIPFVLAVQNSCIYLNLIYNKNLSLFNLATYYLVKDTAISLIIITYVSVLFTDLIYNKGNFNKISNIIIYIVFIILIYIIYFIIKVII